MERKAHLPLNNTVDEQADDGEHRQGGDPFGLLQPHGSDGRGVLDPPKTRFHGGSLVLLGLENLGVRPLLRTHRRGEYSPALVFLRITQNLDLHHHAIA